MRTKKYLNNNTLSDVWRMGGGGGMEEGTLSEGYCSVPVQDGGDLDVGNSTVDKWVDVRYIKAVSKGHAD